MKVCERVWDSLTGSENDSSLGGLRKGSYMYCSTRTYIHTPHQISGHSVTQIDTQLILCINYGLWIRIITLGNVRFSVTFPSCNLLMVGIAVWSISTTMCARAASSLDAQPRATSSTTPWWSTAHRWERNILCMTNTCHPTSNRFILIFRSCCTHKQQSSHGRLELLRYFNSH